MSTWRIIRQFPKYMLVLGVLVTSTVLFWFWWNFRSPTSTRNSGEIAAQKAAKIEEVAATLPAKVGNLIMADGDLYELASGKLLLKQWLKEEQPLKLYYDEEFQKMIGRYPLGLVRFNLNGKQDRSISWQHGLVIDDEMSTALFAKDQDIWKAKIDLRKFELVDEQRVTTTGGIMERFFAQSILLRTPNILIIRNMNQTLRVDLASGNVTSIKMQVPGLKDNRSPDGAVVAGVTVERMRPKFFAYDLEQDDAKQFELDSRGRVTAFSWLNKNLCIFLEGGIGLTVYDRQKQEIRKIMQLPFLATAMVNASPSGRFLFCGSFRESVLVDLKEKKALPLAPPAQHYHWIRDDTLLLARDVPDSNSRGTWLWKIGFEEIRVSTEPYIFTRDATASVLTVPDSEIIAFASRGGLFKLNVNEQKAEMFAPLNNPVTQFVYVEKRQLGNPEP